MKIYAIFIMLVSLCSCGDETYLYNYKCIENKSYAQVHGIWYLQQDENPCLSNEQVKEMESER